MTTTLPAGPRAAARRPATDYADLLEQIKAHQLMRRRYLYYFVKVVVLLAAFTGVWFGFFLLGPSWLLLLVAAAFGLVLTQAAFLSHDAAHRQVFTSGRRNDLLAAVVAGVFCGMSTAWWTQKHSRHHAAPNQTGKDPDIEPTVVRFHPDAISDRPGPVGWLSRHQGWWFFPILLLEGMNLHFQSFQTLLARGPVKRRSLELTFLIGRFAAYLTVLFLFLPLGLAVAFLGVQMAVVGVYMGCSFAPNHKGMPILPENARVDFLRRQVLMSRNINGSRFVTFLMGGLNYQIEHHLFPSMPRPTLRRAQLTVRPFCAERGVVYTETGLLRSYGIVVRYLNRVGLRDRDPFECPMVAAHRPRG
ncbi:acyl-CoA desaturase [Nakamurella silvestris]|nr:acyl-CoA desaturase [Nakamurella silvestris]